MNHDAVVTMALLFAMGGIAILVWLTLLEVMTRRLTACYEQVAATFQGNIEPATWTRYPRLGFSYEGHTVFVDVCTVGEGKNGRHFTRCRLLWPERALRCEIYPHGMFDRLGALFGMRDLDIGSPRFDADYVIQGRDLPAIRGLLSGGVQARINALRSHGNPDVYVSWEAGWLTIRKQQIYRSYEDLHAFVLLSLSLFDAAFATRAEGIEFLGELQQTSEIVSDPLLLPVDQEVSCQVCGERITQADVVFCERCRTPHHADCWNYYGACAVYACGCKRTARIHRARGRAARKGSA